MVTGDRRGKIPRVASNMHKTTHFDVLLASRERPPAVDIRVECYAGYRGEETPRRFRLDGRWVAVAAVLDMWLAPDGRYFRVRGEAGGVYVLSHDERGGGWRLAQSVPSMT